MPSRSSSESGAAKTGGGRGALTGLGVIIVAIQLLILVQLSRHATVVQVSNVSALLPPDAVLQQQQQQQKLRSEATATTRKQVRSRETDVRMPDGSFNGIDVYFHPEPVVSTVSCVGENYQDKTAWMYRSCHFTHLCFDTNEKEYVLFQSPQEREWAQYVQKEDSNIGTSSIMSNMTVGLGGLNPKWMKQNFEKLKWFPKIMTEPMKDGYYALPDDVVWVPFHSFAGFNPGHTIWDDFLPIYTLLSMFGLLEETNRQPLLTRYVLKDDDRLWATCDVRDENREKCARLFQKLLPAMGINQTTFSTSEDVVLEKRPDDGNKSNFVCARHGAAGLSMLTDHGIKAHGWEPKDYEYTHNMGRGPTVYAFRNFVLRNLRVPIEPLSALPRPYKVVFSKFSSQSRLRRTGFQKQLEAVQDEFSSNQVNATGQEMQSLSLRDQVELASTSAVWVTSCGGGAVTATFLPRGATVIIYYDPKGSIVRNKKTYTPARLDWDLFNHMSYLRVHWLPTTDMDAPQGLKVLTQLIRSELNVMKHQ